MIHSIMADLKKVYIYKLNLSLMKVLFASPTKVEGFIR